MGALVAFTDGVPDKSRYRRFKIREVAGQDDYAMLREVVRRHYGKAGQELPDLLVVDGGRGQLNVVLQALKELDLTEIPVVGLAKATRTGRPPGTGPPLSARAARIRSCPRPTPRAGCCSCASGTKPTASPSPTTANAPARSCWPRSWTRAPGIGPVRKRRLLEHFANLEAIKAATLPELAAVPGFNQKVAENLKEWLAGAGEGGRGGFQTRPVLTTGKSEIGHG